MKRRFVIVFAVASMLVLQGNKNMLNVVSAAEVVKETSKAIISDYGTYTLKCQAGSKFMEVYGEITYNEKYKNNAKIVQNEATRIGIWQEWQVIYRKTLNGVKYFELMNLHSGKALAAPCVLAKSGLQLQQNSYTGDDLQLWEIRSVGITGYFNIINKKNGLAITNLKGSSSNNSAIVQEVPGAGEKQNWLFTSINADAYRDDVVVGFFERNDPSQGSVAFDQGNSIPLTWGKNNGKVLWVTQDAWDGKSLQPNNMFCCDDFFKYNNSMFVQQTKTDWSPTCPNIIIDSPMGRPRQICSNQPGTDWSWAGPGIEIGNK
ncbi:MAG TPA: RICIN domain-containing protein, partial [Bacteroidales bacterium]